MRIFLKKLTYSTSLSLSLSLSYNRIIVDKNKYTGQPKRW